MTCCRSSRTAAFTACAFLVAALMACGAPPPASSPAASSAPAVTRDDRQPNLVASRPRIVVLGDSLTAGLGLPPDQAYPTLLQQLLDKEGLKYEVVNAGVSGDTSAGGLARLDWALEGDVRVLIVALG